LGNGKLRWGVIGFGEAGSVVAGHIGEHSKVPVRVTDPLLNKKPVPDWMAKRLTRIEVKIVTDVCSLVRQCDVILSLVTPRVASVVAAEAGATWKHGLFIDLNSISPKEKQSVSACFPKGCYVDGAVLGSIAGEGSRVQLALGGTRATEARSHLSSVGLSAFVAGSRVGAASAVKMCRSLFMKGLECLFVETLLAAKTFDVTDPVMKSIEQTFNSYGLRPMVRMLVTTHAAHSRRRSDEMRSAGKMMDEHGMPGRMCKAARDFLKANSEIGLADHFRGTVPATSAEVLDFLSSAYRIRRRRR
jgi:3-hydroxyisobutyrate dehydrogenase-like beta-hydroxyacid dehydrogenase